MQVASDLVTDKPGKKGRRGWRSSNDSVMCGLAVMLLCQVSRAERSGVSFPDAPSEQPAPVPRRLSPPARSAPAGETAMPAAETATEPAAVAAQVPVVSDRGADTRAAERRRRQAWLLSVEAVTHAPIDMGVQLGVETPQGLRLFGGYGFVPGVYINLLTGIAGNATGSSYGAALLKAARYHGHTWRIQAGLRPFRAIGLYGDLGYARVDATGALDLSSTGIPVLEELGGGYQGHTKLDMWLIELGYEGEIADRAVFALALGFMRTYSVKTTFSAIGGAPTDSAALDIAGAEADIALQKYGFTPTLTLRLGFDLI
jgi:hypothetical protein